MTGPASDDFITIAIPTLNEEHYIEKTLRSLLAQSTPERCEVLVMVGGSTDRTVEIAHSMSAIHPNLRVALNPKRIQSAAINLAARIADPRATALLRADAHALYPSRFVEIWVSALRKTGAASVVVPMQTAGLRGMQRAIAATQNSRLGNGAPAHRRGNVSGSSITATTPPSTGMLSS